MATASATRMPALFIGHGSPMNTIEANDFTRAWARLVWFMWVRPGMMRKIFAAWAKYFLPGFHPWNVDDRHLIAGFDLSGDYGQEPAKTVRGAKAA